MYVYIFHTFRTTVEVEIYCNSYRYYNEEYKAFSDCARSNWVLVTQGTGAQNSLEADTPCLASVSPCTAHSVLEGESERA